MGSRCRGELFYGKKTNRVYAKPYRLLYSSLWKGIRVYTEQIRVYAKRIRVYANARVEIFESMEPSFESMGGVSSLWDNRVYREKCFKINESMQEVPNIDETSIPRSD